MKKEMKLFDLMIELIKIGLLTFGGGVVQYPIIHQRIIGYKKVLSEDNFSKHSIHIIWDFNS